MFKEIYSSKELEISEIVESVKDQKRPFDDETTEQVKQIINEVSLNGDQAIKSYCRKLDNLDVSSIDDLKIDPKEIEGSIEKIDKDIYKSLKRSYKRIFDFQKSLLHPENKLKNITRRNIPVENVLIYIPGGKASYPSTVLMAAAPAKAAGVNQIILTSPSSKKSLNPIVLAAAYLAGIEEVYCLGGAHAIAGFVFKNNSLPNVDKVVGPGNKYVTEAKRQIYGSVGIDLIAGPSEILILGDKHTDPYSTALDLMAQAEHDEEACAILVSLNQEFSKEVENIIGTEVKKLERKDIIKKSLSSNGFIVNLGSIEEAIEFSNQLAPEHLHIKLNDPNSIADEFKYAGTVLIGEESANAISDYALGPSHILPTSGSARFSSQLSVEDFLVHPTSVTIDKEEMKNDYYDLLEDTIILSEAEGLSAHSLSASYRLKKLKG
tara:strand:- start:48 stop:1352 length:1305 start_codon:yes stop_codon:yes gene_type:complete